MTYLDPMISLWGAYMDFFTPDVVLNAYIPNPARKPQHDMLFQQLGGSMLHFAFLSAVLLRYTDDLGVWKILQTAFLIVDIVGLFSVWDALGKQDRLYFAAVRWEDWGCLAILGFCALLRVAFLAELGFRRSGSRVKRA